MTESGIRKGARRGSRIGKASLLVVLLAGVLTTAVGVSGPTTHPAGGASLIETSTTVVQATPTSPVYGQPVTITARVTPNTIGHGTPTGTVSFYAAITHLVGTASLTGGFASVTVSNLGTYGGNALQLTASYGGNGTYAGSTSTVVYLTIRTATTTVSLTATPNPSVPGATVTLRATVAVVAPGAGTPDGGTVTFIDGTTLLGTAPVSEGAATLTTSTLTPGTHHLKAFYSGGPHYNASSPSTPVVQVVETVAATSTLLISTPNPSGLGQPVNLRATVTSTTGSPSSGTVSFFDGTSRLGIAPLVSGVATLTSSSLSAGSHLLRAGYTGSAAYAASTSPTEVQVVATVPGAPAGLTATAEPTAIVLNWIAPGTNGGLPVTGYQVLRGAGPGTEVPLGTIQGTSWTDTTAVPGHTYWYVVEAVNQVGRSAPSNEVSTTIVGYLTAGAVAASPGGTGYWIAGSDGSVTAYGTAPFEGSMQGRPLNRPIVGMTATPDGAGYWLVATDGGIFAFGDARFFGSTGAIHLDQPIVAIAATPDGAGYWMVAADGGVFAFGDAQYLGSLPGLGVAVDNIVGIAPTPDGHGYWMVASDGGVFAFGDAGFFGSLGGLHLVAPIIGLGSSPDGLGYRMVASDGGVFAFGDAPYYGSLGAKGYPIPIIGLIGSLSGYSLVDANGKIAGRYGA